MSIISLLLQNKPFSSTVCYISTTKILYLCSARNHSLHPLEKEVLSKLVFLASQSKHGDVCTQLRISKGSEISQINFKGPVLLVYVKQYFYMAMGQLPRKRLKTEIRPNCHQCWNLSILCFLLSFCNATFSVNSV